MVLRTPHQDSSRAAHLGTSAIHRLSEATNISSLMLIMAVKMDEKAGILHPSQRPIQRTHLTGYVTFKCPIFRMVP